jgi:hypothetical protein
MESSPDLPPARLVRVKIRTYALDDWAPRDPADRPRVAVVVLAAGCHAGWRRIPSPTILVKRG